MITSTNYRDIYHDLVEETNDFTKESGIIKCTQLAAADIIKEILADYYSVIDWGISDIGDVETDNVYMIIYNDRIEEDSFDLPDEDPFYEDEEVDEVPDDIQTESLHESIKLKEDIPSFWEWLDNQGLDADIIEENPDLEDWARQQYDITYNLKHAEDYDLLDIDVPDDYDDFDFYHHEEEELPGYHYVCYFDDDDKDEDDSGDADTLEKAIESCDNLRASKGYDCSEIFGPKGDTVATFWEGNWNTDYNESLTEAKKKVVATITYTYDGSDRAYSDDDDAYKYWCEEIECRPSSLKKKGIGKGDKFTADIVQYDDDEDDIGIINIKKVTTESLTEAVAVNQWFIVKTPNGRMKDGKTTKWYISVQRNGAGVEYDNTNIPTEVTTWGAHNQRIVRVDKSNIMGIFGSKDQAVKVAKSIIEANDNFFSDLDESLTEENEGFHRNGISPHVDVNLINKINKYVSSHLPDGYWYGGFEKGLLVDKVYGEDAHDTVKATIWYFYPEGRKHDAEEHTYNIYEDGRVELVESIADGGFEFMPSYGKGPICEDEEDDADEEYPEFECPNCTTQCDWVETEMGYEVFKCPDCGQKYWVKGDEVLVNEALLESRKYSTANLYDADNLVDSAYNHLTFDLGIIPTPDAVLEEIYNNFDQDIFIGANNPREYAADFRAVQEIMQRLDLEYAVEGCDDDEDIYESLTEAWNKKKVPHLDISYTQLVNDLYDAGIDPITANDPVKEIRRYLVDRTGMSMVNAEKIASKVADNIYDIENDIDESLTEDRGKNFKAEFYYYDNNKPDDVIYFANTKEAYKFCNQKIDDNEEYDDGLTGILLVRMSDDRLVNSWQISNSQRRGNKGWERKFKESLEESANYSNIPLVDDGLSYYNNKLNRLPGLDVVELVKTLDKITEYYGPKFKIRSTKFGRNISWGDIKDEWMSLRRNGWSISQDYDDSLPGFNEVYICSKIAKNESLTEEAHETLNQDLWDENNKLKPEVKEKLDLIVEKFKERLKEDGVDINVDDVVLVGSNANYNYTDKSDIDIHLIADLSLYKGKEDLAQVVYNAYRRLFNDKFDPMIYGHEVELYVEPKEEVDDTMKIKPLESLTEDTGEYYVLSISDRGGNSDYIKGPMTKEEATEYAKILRKDASKYYRERYLVYPKNRIPGRYKHLLANESLNEDGQATEQPMDIYSVFVIKNEKNMRKSTEKARYKLYAKDNKDAWHTVWNGSDMGLPQGILSRANGDRITYVTKGEEPDTEWFLSKGRCPDEVFNKVDSEHKARRAAREKRRKDWDEETSKWKDIPMPRRSDGDALRDWINKQRYIENPEYPEEFLSKLEKQLDDGDRLRTIARLEDGRRNRRG